MSNLCITKLQFNAIQRMDFSLLHVYWAVMLVFFMFTYSMRVLHYVLQYHIWHGS